MPGGVGVEVAYAAYAGADGEGDFAEDGDGGGGRCGECGDGLEGEGLEGVAGEDGDGFAEDDVAGGLAAAEVVVVERGQVVVDEGVGVEHLERGAEVGCACGNLAGAGDHAGGLHAEDGAEALAAGEGAVAHGAVDGVGERVGRGQKAFEGGVGELRRRREAGFVRWSPSGLDDKSSERDGKMRAAVGDRYGLEGARESGECLSATRMRRQVKM